MAKPSDDEEREKPLDPAVERVRRKLVRFVAIHLGLLFLALMAVVAAIVYRASRTDTPPPALAAADLPLQVDGGTAYGEIALPRGARVASHALSGGRLSLHVQLAEGASAIFVYDMAQGRMVGRFDIRQEP